MLTAEIAGARAIVVGGSRKDSTDNLRANRSETEWLAARERQKIRGGGGNRKGGGRGGERRRGRRGRGRSHSVWSVVDVKPVSLSPKLS